MIILEFVIIAAALMAVSLLLGNQIVAQVNEFKFYKRNGWDFSADSGHDKLRLDKKIQIYELSLTNSQRFYAFRPVFILCTACFLGGMIWSLF